MNTEHNTTLASVIGAARAALADFDLAGPSTVLQTVPPLALTLRELLAALSSPPADDVREALVKELRQWAALIGNEPRGARELFTRAADALSEVRPCGTVTETEVEAAAGVIARSDDSPYGAAGEVDQFFEVARAALEAAREARS